METYTRKAVGRRKAQVVQAIQVARPYRDITNAFPRSHTYTKQSGAFNYIRLIDAPEGRNRAVPGDWIVKFEDHVEVLSPEEFEAEYRQGASIDQ